jgi:hypothetical protein
VLTARQRIELSKWPSSRILAAGAVFRARVILAFADGRTYSEIESTLETGTPTISGWRERCETDRARA